MEENKYRRIPFNAFQKGKVLGIDIIRWVEAFIFISIIGFILWLTPFVIKIKVITFIVIGTSIFALSLHGVKNRSITEIFIDIVVNKKNKKKYSLGSVSDERKRNIYNESKFANESNFERAINAIRTTISRFDEKYGD